MAQCASGLKNRFDECCKPNSILDEARECCSGSSSEAAPGLDAMGRCCASGRIDVCGVCDGNSTAVDILGVCCGEGGQLDAAGLCCVAPLAVDTCGICGGVDACAQVVSLDVLAQPAPDSDGVVVEALHATLAARLGVVSDRTRIVLTASQFPPARRLAPAPQSQHKGTIVLLPELVPAGGGAGGSNMVEPSVMASTLLASPPAVVNGTAVSIQAAYDIHMSGGTSCRARIILCQLKVSLTLVWLPLWFVCWACDAILQFVATACVSTASLVALGLSLVVVTTALSCSQVRAPACNTECNRQR